MLSLALGRLVHENAKKKEQRRGEPEARPRPQHSSVSVRGANISTAFATEPLSRTMSVLTGSRTIMLKLSELLSCETALFSPNSARISSGVA